MFLGAGGIQRLEWALVPQLLSVSLINVYEPMAWIYRAASMNTRVRTYVFLSATQCANLSLIAATPSMQLGGTGASSLSTALAARAFRVLRTPPPQHCSIAHRHNNNNVREADALL
jgi:hypothetical protein